MLASSIFHHTVSRFSDSFQNEETALMTAARHGNFDAARVLLDAGADVTSRSKVRLRLTRVNVVALLIMCIPYPCQRRMEAPHCTLLLHLAFQTLFECYFSILVLK